MLRGEPIYLPVDILQSTTKGQEPKAPSLGSHSILILTASPIRASSTQGRRAGQHDHGSEGAPIPGGIRHLWACIREFHSKETRAHGLSHTLYPPNWKISPNWWIHPSKWVPQMLPKWMTPPQRRSMPPSPPTVGTPGPSGDVPLLDIAHLQEEANKALGDWLVIKSSIDVHWWNLVSKFGMTLG